MRRLLCFMGMLLICAQLLAQNRAINGKVADDKGNPLINATVQVKGTTIGTFTNGSVVVLLTCPCLPMHEPL
jgi:hypothetical protein